MLYLRDTHSSSNNLSLSAEHQPHANTRISYCISVIKCIWKSALSTKHLDGVSIRHPSLPILPTGSLVSDGYRGLKSGYDSRVLLHSLVAVFLTILELVIIASALRR